MTEVYTLKAMANNYRNGHSWDHLDGEVCLRAADEIKTLRHRLTEAEKNVSRYEKLRRWMSSNVAEGWSEVEKLAAIACYINWDEFDKQLDALPVCNVGLCQVANPISSSKENKQ